MTTRAVFANIVAKEWKMRTARIKEEGEGWYHVVSRTAFQLFKFDNGDKEMFVRMMRRVASFCGVEILNHCVMSNHFHILLHVPEPIEITEDVLLERIGALYGEDNAKALREHWGNLRKMRDFATLEKEQGQFRRRMGDMSEFMKTLKQRFSIWYRHQHESFSGTLWEGRFKSVILQGSQAILSAVSAYIDLNPVRARMVDDPRKYKWSGYGSAMAGDADSMRGIARVFKPDATDADFIAMAENAYCEILYVKGGDAMGDDVVRDVVARKGKLPMNQLLRCRVRHFLSGVCVGEESFVESFFRSHRGIFGPARKRGARSIGICGDWCGIRLCTARNLKKDAIVARA